MRVRTRKENGEDLKRVLSALFILLVTLFFPSAARASEDGKGRQIYEKYCRWCHGEKGAADGPASELVNPPPRDFTYGLYKWKTTPFDEYSPTDEDILKVVRGGGSGLWRGLNGTAMPSWKGVLSKKEMKEVIDYIKGLGGLEAPKRGPIDLSGRVPSTPESIARGKKIFEKNCTECHGRAGRGDTEKRLKDDFGFVTWPRNLTKPWTFRAGSSPSDIYTRVTVGIQGTQMPSFADPESRKRLTERERWDVANFVATLAAPYKRPAGGSAVLSERVEEPLPDDPESPLWRKAPYVSLFVAPQIVAPPMDYTPTIDSITVRSFYNEKEIAFLLEWDDPTESIPGDRESEKIAGGPVWRDGAALEFPAVDYRRERRPYFGMGGPGSPVRIWFWQGLSIDGPERVRLLEAAGPKGIADEKTGGLRAKGLYDTGTWRVIMKAPLTLLGPSYREGVRHIPVAFALWDGSNGEGGGRHVMTTWCWLVLEPRRGIRVFLWPAVVFVVVALFEIVLIRAVRR